MATEEKTLSQLTTMTTLEGEDLFLVTDDPAGTPVSKKANTTFIFSNIPVDITTSQTIKGNTLVLTSNTFPANSNTVIGDTGSIIVSSDYIYVQANTTICKRVAISTF